MAMAIIMFSFGGLEMLGFTAAEADKPRTVIPKAINQVIYRSLIFYIGALVVLQRHLGQSITPIAVLIGVNVVFGFLFPGIAWQAHLGGLVTGAIVAFGYTAASRRRRGAGGRR